MVQLNTADSIATFDDMTIIGCDSWLERRLDHPEDVAIKDAETLYAGGENGQLYRVDLDSDEVTQLASTGGFVLGVELGPEGDLYACDFQHHTVFRLPLEDGLPAGNLETVVSGEPGEPPWHPNYCLFDQEGRLYISDSGDRANMTSSGGTIYVVESDGTGRIVTDELDSFPNGLALSKDGETLYVAESGTHDVSAVHLDDGYATDVEFITDEFGMIDGLALDADDRLYGASIGDNAVYRLIDGMVELVVHDTDGLHIGNPTNVAFGGEDMRTLYIANLGLWHITAVALDKPGRHPTARL